jgi:large subunit ribosomal protein L19
MNNIMDIVKKQYEKKGRELDKIPVGSKIKVNTKIMEGGKERIQAFEGIVIAKHGSGLDATFTVRKIASGGIGVERTFPLHSPVIQSIKVIKQGKTKRAKLYYLREAFGKKARKESMRFDAEASKEQLESLHMEEEVKEEKKEDVEKKEEKK